MSSESAKLRRRHQKGDSFSGEIEGNTRMNVDGQSNDGSKKVGPVDAHHLLRWQDDVVAAPSPTSFLIRSCYDAPELNVADPEHQASGVEPRHCSEARAVTHLNRWAETEAEVVPARSEKPTRWSLDMSPPTDFVRSFPFPSQELEPGATWEEAAEWTTHSADSPPVDHHRVIVWRFLGVEHAKEGRFARLGCTADYDAHVEAETKAGSFHGEARSKLRCAVRLSLDDGVTGAARVDYTTQGLIEGREGDEEGIVRMGGVGRVEAKAARSMPLPVGSGR